MRGPSSVVAAVGIAAFAVLAASPRARVRAARPARRCRPTCRAYWSTRTSAPSAGRSTSTCSRATRRHHQRHRQHLPQRRRPGELRHLPGARRLDRHADAIRAAPSASPAAAPTRARPPPTMCARDGWTLIADDVRVPASFFLPPGGIGRQRRQQRTPAARDVAGAIALLAHGCRARSLARSARARTVAAQRARARAAAQARSRRRSGRGATLTLDRLNYLVTKDVGSERWSISYSFEPVVSPDGRRRQSIPERHRQRLPARRQPAELRLLHAARRLDRHARAIRRASSASRAQGATRARRRRASAPRAAGR